MARRLGGRMGWSRKVLGSMVVVGMMMVKVSVVWTALMCRVHDNMSGALFALGDDDGRTHF